MRMLWMLDSARLSASPSMSTRRFFHSSQDAALYVVSGPDKDGLRWTMTMIENAQTVCVEAYGASCATSATSSSDTSETILRLDSESLST